MTASSVLPVLPSAPDYAPFRVPFRLRAGLHVLDLRDWIEPDEHFARELAEKERLLQERPSEVFAALPEAFPASIEVLELLAAHLPARFPLLYQKEGEMLTNLITRQHWHMSQKVLHPLDLAGRLIQEDLCVMQPDPVQHTYRLVGASLCFPTRWRLADKMGKALTAIHNPVPGYEEQLAPTVDRFFERLKAEKPVWRINWGLIDDPTLFQPAGHGRAGLRVDITAKNAGEKLWVRMERQTLRRLPQSQDVLFTIRVYVRPLQYLLAHPDRAALLAASIRGMPEPLRRYKSLPPYLDATLAWLDRVANEKKTERGET